MSTVKHHGYYLDKARRRLARAGVPDADPAPLAEWAADVDREGRQRRSALVAQSGAVIAECVLVKYGPDMTVRHVIDEDAERHDLSHTERGLAMGLLKRRFGPLIEVPHWEIASGPGER